MTEEEKGFAVDFLDRAHEIARVDSPEDYKNSGVLCCRNGERFALVNFGHCSCFDTYQRGVGDDRPRLADWVGTRGELQEIVQERWDISLLPTKRELNEKDYDYKKWNSLYRTLQKYLWEVK